MTAHNPSSPALTPGSLTDVEISDLTVEGGSLARHDGQVLFLDRGLPGEKVRARIDSQQTRFARGTVQETLTPSPHAVAPHCPHAGECGGCTWPGLSYEEECRWKRDFLAQSLRRIAKLSVSTDGSPIQGTLHVPPIIPSPRSEGYRNKLELAFAQSGPHTLIGMKKRASGEIVPIENCPLVSGSIAPLLKAVRSWLETEKLPAWNGKSGFLRHLVVRRPEYAPEDRQQCLVELITVPYAKLPREQAASFAAAVEKLPPLLAVNSGAALCSSFVHSARGDKAPVAYGEKIIFSAGPRHMTEKVGPLLLEAGPRSFFQANTDAAALLYAAAVDFAGLGGQELVWDMYCGVGGIALALAPHARSVSGFEISPEAVATAQTNALRNGAANTEFIKADVATYLHGLYASPDNNTLGKPDVVIADPPRAGLDERVVAALRLLAPEKIVAVSCSPGTLARDLLLFAKPAPTPAYTLTRVQGVDLFPHTPHLEVVALLERC